MFLATSKLVDIVAHPWWWHDHFKYPDGSYVPGPWTDDFDVIPESYHDEFAAALVAGATAFEISYGWLAGKPYGERFYEQYLEHLAYMKERGVRFATGSDCHRRPYKTDLVVGQRLLDCLGTAADDLWRLPPRPSQPGGIQ